VWLDWAKFRRLGAFFFVWVHFVQKNITQMIWAQFFFRKIAQNSLK
jgi:hypothetical protein